MILSATDAFSYGDTTYFKKNRKIIIESKDQTKILKFKRNWIEERSIMLFTNLTRIFTLRIPLIGIDVKEMQEGAYLHSLDMAM